MSRTSNGNGDVGDMSGDKFVVPDPWPAWGLLGDRRSAPVQQECQKKADACGAHGGWMWICLYQYNHCLPYKYHD